MNGRLIKFDGKSLTVKQWAEELGMPIKTLCTRLSTGMPLERALSVTAGRVSGRTYLYKGELLGVTALAAALGIKQTTLSNLFNRGATLEDVLKKYSK